MSKRPSEKPSPFESNPQAFKLFLKSLKPGQLRKFDELIKNIWWWRNDEALLRLESEVDWPTAEEAARNYELMRRSHSGKQFASTYTELGRGERTLIHVLWPILLPVPYRFVTDQHQFEEHGWSPIYENQHRQWNLRLPVSDLVNEFTREMKVLQEIQKICPEPVRQGEKSVISWKLIEVLDCKLKGIGPLNDSERHTLSVARRKATKYFREFKNALMARSNSSDPLNFTRAKPNKD